MKNSKFESLIESIVGEAKEDAPNYRKSKSDSEGKCKNCQFAKNGNFCDRFDFPFEIGYTCDAFEPR